MDIIFLILGILTLTIIIVMKKKEKEKKRLIPMELVSWKRFEIDKLWKHYTVIEISYKKRNTIRKKKCKFKYEFIDENGYRTYYPRRYVIENFTNYLNHIIKNKESMIAAFFPAKIGYIIWEL